MSNEHVPPVMLKPGAVPVVLIKPVASAEELVEAWINYQKLKSKLLNENDYCEIRGTKFIKRSGWRKLGVAFSLTDEIVSETKRDYKDYFVIEVVAKITAPNGRSAIGIGSCASNERNFRNPHNDVRATAHTRAKSRGISDILGSGEVTAEEIADIDIPAENDSWHENLFMDEKEAKEETSEASSKEWSAISDVITHKQRGYLVSIINERIEDDEERENQLAQLDSLSKNDASELIQTLLDRPVF